jgi:pSer/pThr/pTyr-binding forkhead associated (FHA) protein
MYVYIYIYITTTIGEVGSKSEDMTIGRSRLNQFCLDDLSVSKQHAVITYVSNVGYFLKDLGSKHGTFVDGSRVSISPDINEKNMKMKKSAVNNDSSVNSTIGYDDNRTVVTDGMEIRFGRIVCQLKRRRQSAIITSG